jgi:hypothetical protein
MGCQHFEDADSAYISTPELQRRNHQYLTKASGRLSRARSLLRTYQLSFQTSLHDLDHPGYEVRD